MKFRLLNVLATAFLATFLLVAAGARESQADWSWEEMTTTTIQLGNTVKNLGQNRQSVSLKVNIARIDDLEQGGVRFLNFQSQAAVLVNFRSRAFFTVPLSELRRMLVPDRASLRASLDQKEAEAANQPGEEGALLRAQIQAQRKKYALWDQPYSLRPTPDRTEINGHPCVRYEGLAGTEVFQEIWVAEDLPLDSDFFHFFATGMAEFDPQTYSHYRLLPAFPLKVISHYGPVTVTTSVLSVSTSSVPLEAFLLPSDLREIENKVMPGQ